MSSQNNSDSIPLSTQDLSSHSDPIIPQNSQNKSLPITYSRQQHAPQSTSHMPNTSDSILDPKDNHVEELEVPIALRKGTRLKHL